MKPLTLNGTLLWTVTIFIWGFRHKIKIVLQKTKLGQKIKETISKRGACQNESTWTTLIIRYTLQAACKLGLDIVVNWLFPKVWIAQVYLDPHGTTALHVACKYRQDSIVNTILKKPAHVHKWDRYGITPLHIACQYGHKSTVEILLKYPKQVCNKGYFQFDRNGTTPLHVACQYGHNNIVTCFLDHPDARIDKGIINQCDRNGTTPLHVACQYGHDSIVKTLLSKGANINQLDLKKRTPQRVAIETGHDNIVKLLQNTKSEDASY